MWFEAAEQDVLPGSRNPEPPLIIPGLFSPFCTEKKLISELEMTYVWGLGKIQWLREKMAEGVSTIKGWNHLETSTIFLSLMLTACWDLSWAPSWRTNWSLHVGWTSQHGLLRQCGFFFLWQFMEEVFYATCLQQAAWKQHQFSERYVSNKIVILFPSKRVT